MLAVDAPRYRPHLRLLDRPLRRPPTPIDAGEPAAFPAATPFPRPVAPGTLAPTGEARVLRRLRHVVRRRVRIELAGLVSASVSDGDLSVHVDTVSPREPRIVEWTADRLVALVVLHDGCGARVIGGGGLMGRIELPSVTCGGAFLAFCYDGEAGSMRL